MDKFIYFANYISEFTTHHFNCEQLLIQGRTSFWETVLTQVILNIKDIYELSSTEEKAHNICIFLSASFSIVFSLKFQKASTRVDSTNKELVRSEMLVMAKQ